jgi:hypothetical protein
MTCKECPLLQAARKLDELAKKQEARSKRMADLTKAIRQGRYIKAEMNEYDELYLSPINFEDAILGLREALKTVEKSDPQINWEMSK